MTDHIESGDALLDAYNRAQRTVLEARQAVRQAERALALAVEVASQAEHTTAALIAMLQDRAAE